MIRTTLIALAAAATLGSASAALAAHGLDSDNNPIPGASALVNRPAAAFERSYAGPYRYVAPIQDQFYFDRHTQVD
jgi:hypothetical protein